MGERDRRRHEYLARLEAEAAGADEPVDEEQSARERAQRNVHRGAWIEVQLQQAMRAGEFDDLPGAGKPIPGIDRPHDPDWWLKRLVEREKISVLPPALALRTEDARLDEVLDREPTADGVRRVLDDFNARVVDARRQLQGGPPVITPLRDVEAEVDAWSSRRAERVALQKARLAEIRAAEAAAAPPPWWRRLLDRLRLPRSRHLA